MSAFPSPHPDTLLTVRQAAMMLGYTPAHVQLRIKQGKLAVKVVGRRGGEGWCYLISRASVEALKAQRALLPVHLAATRDVMGTGYVMERLRNVMEAEQVAGYLGLVLATIALAIDDARNEQQARQWLSTTGKRWLASLGVDDWYPARLERGQ